MPTLRRVRSLVCLLLAVSTAIAGAAPARACACASPAGGPGAPVKHRAATPAPAVKPCCQSNAKKRSCCSPTSAGGTAAKASCCGDDARAGKSPSVPTPTDVPGCHCLRCACDAPSVPAPAAPGPVVPDLDEHAAVSPVPLALISEPPTTASRGARSVSVAPPTDLVISLSRLTC